MSESNVVGIRPNMAPPSFEPNEQVVQYLEELLSAAKSGEVQGIAASIYHRDDTHTTLRVCIRNLATIGNLERLKFDILHDEAHQ